MNQAIELHDSTIHSIVRCDGTLTVESAIYIHESAGVPGADSGIGWFQRATFTLEAGAVEYNGMTCPCSVDGGRVIIGDKSFENCVPLPLTSQPLELEFDAYNDKAAGTIRISGQSAQLILHEVKSPVEDFQP